jgi:hypothetical protein
MLMRLIRLMPCVGDDDATASLNKCLRPGGIPPPDENMVDKALTGCTERGGGHAVMSAARTVAGAPDRW